MVISAANMAIKNQRSGGASEREVRRLPVATSTMEVAISWMYIPRRIPRPYMSPLPAIGTHCPAWLDCSRNDIVIVVTQIEITRKMSRTSESIHMAKCTR